MNELALFAGAGGGLLGSILLGWHSVCYVEKDPYCVKVLRARIREGYLCDAPIWSDVETFDGKPWRGLVDIVTAGFPCQPFSVAGKRKGADDKRNMWPETIRIIREVRPRYALCENVPGLISGDHGYFGRILNDLSESGYDARWRIISAADVGAPHLRKRLWIKAMYSKGERLVPVQVQEGKSSGSDVWKYDTSGELSDAFRDWEISYGEICGVDDGLSVSVDRLKAIGNAQVPGVVALA